MADHYSLHAVCTYALAVAQRTSLSPTPCVSALLPVKRVRANATLHRDSERSIGRYTLANLTGTFWWTCTCAAVRLTERPYPDMHTQKIRLRPQLFITQPCCSWRCRINPAGRDRQALHVVHGGLGAGPAHAPGSPLPGGELRRLGRGRGVSPRCAAMPLHRKRMGAV